MKKNNRLYRSAAAAAVLSMLGSMCGLMPVQAAAPQYYADLDGNGTINACDLSVMKTMIANGQSVPAADVDADGKTTVEDAVMLQEYLLAKRSGFPAGSTMPELPTRYWAIEAAGDNGWEESTNEGFEGAAYWNFANEIGSSLTFTVDVPAAGNYQLVFRYANGGSADDNRTCQISVNGADESLKLDFPHTGNWVKWDTSDVVMTLKAGKNTIHVSAVGSGGGPNLDYLDLIPTDAPAAALQKAPKPGALRMENLDRGVIAANAGNGILVSWRILGEDDENTRFELYKNGQTPPIYTGTVSDASSFLDASGTTGDWYTVDVYQGDTCTEFACGATKLYNKDSSGGYLDLLFDPPADMTMPDGTTCSYTVNDCSVGDIDGDGQYEIFVKWDPSNSHDNADAGYTGNVFIDCWRLDGTKVWRIDLGRNIRAGAHYTQFMVYDFDGDNCAEMICKTSDATVDGTGKVIGNANADYRDSTPMKLRDGSYAPSGRILSGPEYLTLFDGKTGAALDTTDYVPGRGTVGDWGDTWGNRVDRFTGCVAYLGGSGETASAVFGRGYYTRSTVTAWDVRNKKLVMRWAYDTGTNASTPGYGDGNHHILAADCDGDGKQEVVVGSAVVDDNGKLLYTTGLAHGDAIHIGDFDPTNPGLEIFQCLEDEKHPNGKAIGFGTILRAAGTGKVLFRETAGGDTGRCICDNMIAGNAGAEMAGSHNEVLYDAVTHQQLKDSNGVGMIYSSNGGKNTTNPSVTKWGENSLVYWDGDLERESLDRCMVDAYGKGRLFTGSGVTYNNYTKSNACLTCDLFGDWREEMIFRLSEGSGIRIYTTTYTTEYGIVSLMHNPQYRVQVAAQNNGYNQPPHLDYFIGTGFPIPKNPAIYTE
ncbi:MAG TPA: carbohydrate-binding protein [Ruminococcus sp.]|nr:carbohydrate-binding protein [Ruminococcus sp.]